MTHRRRAPQRIVVGAALCVLVVLGGCADPNQVTSVADPALGTAEPRQAEATAVATTAPAALPTPSSQVVLPSPVSVPTAIPTVVETAEPPVSPADASPAPVSPVPVSPTAAPTLEPQAAPPDSSAALAANGAEIYTLTCARCHGENGLGSVQYSAPLVGVGSRFSTQAMITELTTGHPVTFGFADRLTPEEIAAVVAYVKSVFP